MSMRDDALREPARPESMVFAMCYVGDQIGALLRALDRPEVPNHVGQAAKAPQSDTVPPRPMGASGTSGKKKPVDEPVEITTDPVTEVEKGRSK